MPENDEHVCAVSTAEARERFNALIAEPDALRIAAPNFTAAIVHTLHELIERCRLAVEDDDPLPLLEALGGMHDIVCPHNLAGALLGFATVGTEIMEGALRGAIPAELHDPMLNDISTRGADRATACIGEVNEQINTKPMSDDLAQWLDAAFVKAESGGRAPTAEQIDNVRAQLAAAGFDMSKVQVMSRQDAMRTFQLDTYEPGGYL